MSVMKIYLYPDPALRATTETVTEFDDELKKLVRDMFETMYSADGVGLAAPQVGAAKKIIVVDYRGDKYVLINPEISEEGPLITNEEGCLSFPGVYENVESPEYFHIKYQNEEGETIEKDVDGFLACIFSHETDHLNGRLLIDRISPLKRQFMKKKIAKRAKERP